MSRPNDRPMPSRPMVVECLEERVVMTADIAAISDIDYEWWKQQVFTIDQVEVAYTDSEIVDFLSPEEAAAADGPDAQLQQSLTLIGAGQARSTYGYTGAGYSVAIIDTGVDLDHPAFAGRIVGGYDFVNNDALADDDNGHGTHVAGIVGGVHASYGGVAPGVNIIPLKVLAASGSGSFGAVEQALQWVISNQARYNIVAINLSLGSGNYTTNPFTFLEDEFSSLTGSGVFIAAASGNSFHTFASAPGLGYPAISSQTVSVGAVYDANVGSVTWGSGAIDHTTAADRVTSFTQRSAALDLLAPGAMITAAYMGGGYATLAGTSMASPVVAGAAALLHQALDATGQGHLANQNYIENVFKQTGVSVVDGDDENDNVTNTGLTFKRLNLLAALNSVHIVQNGPPILGAIADRTVAPQTNAVIDLSVSDPNNDPVTLSAAVTTLAKQLDDSLRLNFLTSYYENYLGLGEKWIRSEKEARWYFITAQGDLYRQEASGANTFVVKVGAKYNQNPELLWRASEQTTPAATTSISGKRLTVTPAAGFEGDLIVTVTASDGIAVTKREFRITVVNRPPTLAAIPNQVIGLGRSAVIDLQAADPDGQTLRYTVQVAPLAQLLDDQLQLTFNTSYFTNVQGRGEKWIWSAKESGWYFITPDGTLYKYSTTSASPVVAKFDPADYANPELLWKASETTGVNTQVSVVGNRLTLTPPSGFAGVLGVTVTASDGYASVTQSFQLEVTNQAPTLGPLADQQISIGQAAQVTLAAADPEGAPLTYTVSVLSRVKSLDVTLGLTLNGSYYDNYLGRGEKWLWSTTQSKWYYITADGSFFRYEGSAAPVLIAKLDPSYNRQPETLWRASEASDVPVQVTRVGNQLTIAPPANFAGELLVEVTVSDGNKSATRSFTLTVSNQAPTLQPLPDRQVSIGQAAVVDLVASDPEGRPLNFAIAVLPQAQLLDQKLGLTFNASYYENHLGLGEKWIWSAAESRWYYITPDGTFYQWAGSAAASTVYAKLDASFHRSPETLWRASENPGPAASVNLAGNRLTITPPAGYVGQFAVEVTASDGHSAVTRSFTLTVANLPPTLAPLADRQIPVGGSALVDLVASDPEGVPVSVSVTVAPPATLLDQQLRLTFRDSYYTNYLGQGEHWLWSSAENSWYYITSSGGFYRYQGAGRPGVLVTQLDVSYHRNPELLWRAADLASVNVQVAQVGSRLTITPPANYVGPLVVAVTVSDGYASVTRQFTLTVGPGTSSTAANVADTSRPGPAVVPSRVSFVGSTLLLDESALAIGRGTRLLVALGQSDGTNPAVPAGRAAARSTRLALDADDDQQGNGAAETAEVTGSRSRPYWGGARSAAAEDGTDATADGTPTMPDDSQAVVLDAVWAEFADASSHLAAAADPDADEVAADLAE